MATSATSGGDQLAYRLSNLQTRNAFSQPALTRSSGRDPTFTASAGAIVQSTPEDGGQVRQLKHQLRELQVKLAEVMLSKTTAEEEAQHLRQRLQSSEEALIQFAERARADREEAGRKRLRSMSDGALLGHQDEAQ